MHVLLNLKSYGSYFSLLLANKKNSEWESALALMKENKELEFHFREKMKEENDIENINFTIKKLWNEYKKLSHQKETEGKAEYVLNLLSDTVEVLFSFNKLMNNYLNNEMDEHKNYINMFFLMLIKCIQTNSNENNLHLKKLENFLVCFKFSKNIINYFHSVIKLEEVPVNPNIENLLKTQNNTDNTFLDENLNTNKQIIPYQWKLSEMPKFITFSQNGLEAIYTSDEYTFYTIKSNIPIANTIGIYYFEIEILNICEDVMAIGFIGKDFSVSNKIPGWESNSIGYHSDDGNIFISKTNGEPYGPTYKSNDIIGCCVDFINKIVFFTKNGEQLKSVIFEADFELYPAIGMRKNNQTILANFGERNFYFDFKKYYDKVYDELIEDILKTNTSKLNIKIDNILDYLLHNGYVETFTCLNGNKAEDKVKSYLTNKDYSNFLNFIREKYQKCEVCEYFIITLNKLTNSLEKALSSKLSNGEIILLLKHEIILSTNYKLLRDQYKNDFFTNIISSLIKSAIQIEHDTEYRLEIERVLREELHEKNIYSIINKMILEFECKENALDLLYTNTLETIKENLVLKNPTLNFLLANKNFINKLNEKYKLNFSFY